MCPLKNKKAIIRRIEYFHPLLQLHTCASVQPLLVNASIILTMTSSQVPCRRKGIAAKLQTRIRRVDNKLVRNDVVIQNNHMLS